MPRGRVLLLIPVFVVGALVAMLALAVALTATGVLAGPVSSTPSPSLTSSAAARATPLSATPAPTPSGVPSTAGASPSAVLPTVVAPPPAPSTTLAPSSPAAQSTPATGSGVAGAAGAAYVPVLGVSDGDTITVRLGGVKERIRIIGLNAPELHPLECYGPQAASKMQSLVQGKQVQLLVDPTQADRDRYGRLLRHVVLQNGKVAAGVMISEGLAREYTYAKPYAYQASFRAAEQKARAAKLGIWSAGCTLPAPVASPTVPRTTPKPTPKPSVTAARPLAGTGTGNCTIKGNINSKGEKIFHVPGQRFYAATVITPSKGERWFCSVSEALAAGWRAAKV